MSTTTLHPRVFMIQFVTNPDYDHVGAMFKHMNYSESPILEDAHFDNLSGLITIKTKAIDQLTTLKVLSLLSDAIQKKIHVELISLSVNILPKS